MVNKILITLCMFLIWGLQLSLCQGEVQWKKDSLSVSVEDASVSQVLEEISRQRDIRIITLEETKVGRVKVSKQFWNVTLEEGLVRLLNGWNYGFIRDPISGKISTLYLVSQRPEVATLSTRVSAAPLIEDSSIGSAVHTQTVIESIFSYPQYSSLEFEEEEEDEDDE